jgi:hypothetical protein
LAFEKFEVVFIVRKKVRKLQQFLKNFFTGNVQSFLTIMDNFMNWPPPWREDKRRTFDH